MTDSLFTAQNSSSSQHNQPVLSVSDLSGALKRTVEDAFSLVRVRGEISGFKRAASGHLYLALKDENAVMDAVCWKGVANRLDIRPQDGMEVVCTGRLTTYAGRSKYQMVIESMTLAGEGALLKLLEDLKRKLAAEGLFDQARKKPLPFLPQRIGIVTSPTGAVIRDIMHRLTDRFPRPVQLWPCLVQGKGAADQVAAAIKGFNALPKDGPVPRPDLLIVARGGGSLEDLWSFNEEHVVRAAAESQIPLISAVGHETDTTLIDYASDRRAPTPTAAAEMAVPVRRELLVQVMEDGSRLVSGMNRIFEDRSRRVDSAARAIPHPQRVLEERMQRIDDRGERLSLSMNRRLERQKARLDQLGARLPSPAHMVMSAQERLSRHAQRLDHAYQQYVTRAQSRYERTAALMRPKAVEDRLTHATHRLDALTALLESYSYKSVLNRGFALVSDATTGQPVLKADGLTAGQALTIQFKDDVHVGVTVGHDAAPVLPAVSVPEGSEKKAPEKSKKPQELKKKPSPPSGQGSLF